MKGVLRYWIAANVTLSVWGLITRLPCKMGANFTVLHKDHHFIGNAITTLINATSVKPCGLECIAKYSTCSFFNYYPLEYKCELFDASDGYIEQRMGASIYYAKTFEYCSGIWKEFFRCTAICSEPGYINEPLSDIAIDKEYFSDCAVYGNNQLQGAFNRDGLSSVWSPRGRASDNIAWMLIDFGQTESVEFILMYSKPLVGGDCTHCHAFLFGFNITVGDNNEDPKRNSLCVFNGNQVGLYKKWYDCLGGKMIGRYLYFGSDRTGRPTFMDISEFHVF